MASNKEAPIKAPSTRLSDLGITEFSLQEVSKPPVFFVHAPREAGSSTLLASLFEGVVVLCDRPSPQYMGEILPNGVIHSKPGDSVLKALIDIQSHRLSLSAKAALPRLALVLDDVLYTAKMLKSEAFQRNIKRAKDFNIMVVIATSDADLLPKNIPTLATHVFATKCVSTEEPKLLQKKMFVMFDSATALMETLVMCRRHEFLVGLMRPSETSRTLTDFTRSYVPEHFVADEDSIPADESWSVGPVSEAITSGDEADGPRVARALPATALPSVGTFVMSDDLICHISQVLEKL